MYEAIVLPMVGYAALFWHTAMDIAVLQRKLNTVQRLGCLAFMPALRTTPLVTLEVLSGILPIDLYLQYRAACTAYRLQNLGFGPRGGARLTVVVAFGGNSSISKCQGLLTFRKLPLAQK